MNIIRQLSCAYRDQIMEPILVNVSSEALYSKQSEWFRENLFPHMIGVPSVARTALCIKLASHTTAAVQPISRRNFKKAQRRKV